MSLGSTIRNKHSEFLALCHEYKVMKLYAFGSSITDRFDPRKSDIDVIVELDIQDPIDYGDALLSLWDRLEIFFDRKVDLLTDASIQNPYLRKSIDSTKKLIYDGQREEVLV